MKRLLSLIVAAMLITVGTMAREEVTIDKDNCTITKNGEGQFMTTAEISDKLVIKGSIKKPMPLNRLGMLIKKAGYQNKMAGASRTRGWIVRERGMEEVNANRNIEGRS